MDRASGITADDKVELAQPARIAGGACLEDRPFQGCRLCAFACTDQDVGVPVNPDDVPGRSDEGGGKKGDIAGASSDVQNGHSFGKPEILQQVAGDGFQAGALQLQPLGFQR